MAYDSNMLMIAQSSRMGGKYECHRFKEYRVDIDLETDSDGFDFVFKNPDGVYTALFSRFDKVDIKINNTEVMTGMIDDVNYKWDETDSYIHIVGRDAASSLVDNDALPCTKLNVNPISYIKSKASEYGISKVVVNCSLPVTPKLIIGTGETEMSIISNLLVDNQKRIWLVYDTLYIGDWSTNGQIDYYFTRGLSSEYSGIPIKSLSLDENGTSMKSELLIYGSTDDGTNKVVGTAKNEYMISKGIKKRSVERSYNNDSSSKYASNALKKVRDSFRDNTIIEITVKTDKVLVLPNKIAYVADATTGINSTFFVKSVSYSKSADSGSLTKIQMVPSDQTFNVIWSGQGTKSNGGVTKQVATTNKLKGLSLSEISKLRQKGLI